MNPCKFNTYLTAYVLRDMDQKRLDALEAHLKTCPECQKKASELRDTLSLLKEAFPAEKAQTGKAPVLDPERRQQLLTIKPLPKPNIFWKFMDKAYRPLRMIAATLICVFGLLVILSASLNQFIGMFSTAGKDATGDSLGGGGGGREVFFALAAKGAAGDSAGQPLKAELLPVEATDSLTTVLKDSDARMDASVDRKSKSREQAGQKLGDDAGWSGGDKGANKRSKAKHADRNADGYEAGLIVNGPAAAPEPKKTQPEAIDEVAAVKSPVVMRGVYASRTTAGHVSTGPSGRVSTAPEGATTPAPAETVATPPAPATPMPTAGRNSFAYDKEVAAPEKPESSTRFRLEGAKSGLAKAAGDASMARELRTKSESRRDFDGDGFAVIPREEVHPAATPEPFSPQPANFDSVAMVKSPITMKGIYASRSPGSRGNLSLSLENEKSASVAADMPSPAGKSSDDVPVVLLDGAAAPSQPASGVEGGAKSDLGRVAGEESQKDALRQLEPLKIQAAKPSFTGTPKDIRSANLEKPGERDNKPADYPVVSYERTAESKVGADSKFQKSGNGGLAIGATVVCGGTLITGRRELKRSEVPKQEEESSKQVVDLNGASTLSGTTKATSDFKLGINNELKKAKADDDSDAFAYSDGAKAKDQSRLWSDSSGRIQKAEKKLEEFAEAADLRRKPSPPREPLPFNSFVLAAAEPFSTFAMDVDTASYTLTRQALRSGKLPDPERVRLEEIVNAFDYADTAPDRATFRVYQDGAQSPFGAGYNLLRIGVKGRRLGREEQRPAMLTFVIDVSGSMSQPDRIGFARQALSILLEQVGSGDRIQIIAYSDHAQFVLPPSPASEKARIMAAFDRLQCNGSTNLEEGLRRAYEQAGQAFIPGAENRV
ncbi:MAG: von Willebrand factor type A domain-containing protein, partial [bacterium]